MKAGWHWLQSALPLIQEEYKHCQEDSQEILWATEICFDGDGMGFNGNVGKNIYLFFARTINIQLPRLLIKSALGISLLLKISDRS